MINLGTMRRTLVVLAVLGCSGGGGGGGFGPGPGGTCQEPDGVYIVTYTRRSGDCANLPEYVFDTDEPDEVSDCSETGSVSEDGCVVAFERECPAPGAISRDEGAVTWNASGTAATGSYSVILSDTDGFIICRGAYSVRISKQ